MKKLILVLVGVVGFCLPGVALAFDVWPDTGQTKCYNDTVEIPCPQPGQPFYGQDAQYAGPARSYTKLGANDVVLPDNATQAGGWIATRDNVTGLIWEMKTDDNTIHDKDNTYTWCDTNPATNGGNQGICGNGTDTEDFINALNTPNFGGHNDWRLPTIKELSTLANSGIPYPGPTIDATYFPGTVSSLYWSSSVYTAYVGGAWNTGFNYAHVSILEKSYSLNVRAVRGPKTSNVYTDNNDGTIIDTATGLMWQKCSMGQTWNSATNGCAGSAIAYTWQNALAQSENLTFAGFSDWRLPDRNELQTLVDYSRYSPSINTTYFPGTVSSNYWSSTTIADYTLNAWEVVFNLGYITSYDKSNSYYVRAVRGKPSVPAPNRDSDGDGVPDTSDGCSGDPQKTAPGICGCGVSDTDSDSDGTANCNDLCPDNANKIAPGVCGCTVADTDKDLDGIANCIDNCPQDANPGQSDIDGDGAGDICDLDEDNDGTPAAVEDAAPNGGDANNDGILDSDQETVASLVSATGNEYLTVDTITAGGGSELAGVSAVDTTQLPVDPVYDLPYGLVGFTVLNPGNPGFSETARIYFHGVADLTGYVYRKFDPNTSSWYTLSDVVFGVEVIGECPVAYADLPLTDGGDGDSDLLANGSIVDPGGPALPLQDSDGDGIPDANDNCIAVSNPNQRDTDRDGYGNICDPDFNGDKTVNFADLAQLKSVFFSTSRPNEDLNGDGSVNFGDLAILKSYFFKSPGPSGLVQ